LRGDRPDLDGASDGARPHDRGKPGEAERGDRHHHVAHYDSVLALGLSAGQQSDLVEYLKSL